MSGVSTPSQEDVSGLVELSGQKGRPPVIGVHLLHEAAMRCADLAFGRTGTKAENFVGLLLGHGTAVRAARASRALRPRITVSMSVFTPTGMPAVEISLHEEA